MDSSPMVSVITASYNNATFLEACIRGMMDQSLEDWEWIIVDNGSTDATCDILSKLDDSRIRVIRIDENLGVSGGRNVALKEMKGKYFCFLDGDDVIPPESLASRFKLLEERSELGAVDGSAVTFRGELSNAIARYTPSYEGMPLEPLLSLDGACFFGNTWMIRRRDIDYTFKEGLTHGEEILFYAQFAADAEYSYTDETILFYRKHSDSAMANLGGLLKGYQDLIKELGQLGNVPENLIQGFQRAARRIMFRTYLKKLQPFKALQAWFSLTY